jgi:phage regulator Rha-like protein
MKPATVLTIAGLDLAVMPTETRADTRVLAEHLGNKHKNVFELVKDYRAEFGQLGVVPFQTEKPTSGAGGRPERFALLNEDQAYLLLTFSRNTAKVRALKVKLVQAFGEARRAAQQRAVEYLPTYHQLHDVVAFKAAGSANQRFVHMNLNKLVNRTCGLEAGQRLVAPMAQQSMLSVAQTIAASAMRAGCDHHDGYQRAKSALQALHEVAAIGIGSARVQRPR